MIPVQASPFAGMPTVLIQEIMKVAGQNYGLLDRRFAMAWYHAKSKAIQHIGQNYVFKVIFPNAVTDQRNLRTTCQDIIQLAQVLKNLGKISTKNISRISLVTNPLYFEQVMSSIAKGILNTGLPFNQRQEPIGRLLGVVPAGAFSIYGLAVGIENTLVPLITVSSVVGIFSIPISCYAIYKMGKSYIDDFRWRRYCVTIGGDPIKIQNQLMVSMTNSAAI
jgi:hypothetical protein